MNRYEYTIHSTSEREHEVSWPDGHRVTVAGPWRLAAEIGSGRAMVTERRGAAARLQAFVRRLTEKLGELEADLTDVIAATEDGLPERE